MNESIFRISEDFTKNKFTGRKYKLLLLWHTQWLGKSTTTLPTTTSMNSSWPKKNCNLNLFLSRLLNLPPRLSSSAVLLCKFNMRFNSLKEELTWLITLLWNFTHKHKRKVSRSLPIWFSFALKKILNCFGIWEPSSEIQRCLQTHTFF